MASLITIVLVDDHPLILEGLRSAIGAQPDMRVVGVATRLDVARKMVASRQPSVVVLDIRLPDGSGFGLVDTSLPTRWLLLSSFGTAQYVEEAIRIGASGYHLKSAPTSRVLAAIRTVADGGMSFDSALTRRRSAATHRHRLSDRERDVLGLLVTGCSNDEIGTHLGIAKKTVETHLARLYERFGCASRTELAVLAEREGWLDLPGS